MYLQHEKYAYNTKEKINSLPNCSTFGENTSIRTRLYSHGKETAKYKGRFPAIRQGPATVWRDTEQILSHTNSSQRFLENGGRREKTNLSLSKRLEGVAERFLQTEPGEWHDFPGPITRGRMGEQRISEELPRPEVKSVTGQRGC